MIGAFARLRDVRHYLSRELLDNAPRPGVNPRRFLGVNSRPSLNDRNGRRSGCDRGPFPRRDSSAQNARSFAD
jgi:hypothetical protein